MKVITLPRAEYPETNSFARKYKHRTVIVSNWTREHTPTTGCVQQQQV